MSETDRAALLAYVQHKPKCDSFHCGCEHCYPDVKHLPPGVYVHTYQPRSCDCGLDVLLTTLESSDQTPALRALVEQWRASEKQLRAVVVTGVNQYLAQALVFGRCADELSALLSSSPADRETP
jgi:hypothetical protein